MPEQKNIKPARTPKLILSSCATRLLKRYGNAENARTLFRAESQKYQPPFSEAELDAIWDDAVNFYSIIAQENDYIPPDLYNQTKSYRPSDFSDVGQANVLAQYCRDRLRYTKETGFLYYAAGRWTASEPKAQWCVHELTSLQLAEAECDMTLAKKAFYKTGGTPSALTTKSSVMSDRQKQIQVDYNKAERYHNFAVQRRISKNVSATLKEVRPLLKLLYSNLDANGFLLNTPAATYDLHKGLDGAKPHNPYDYITKITSVSPGNDGEAVWQAFLQQVFCGDRELIDYIQLVCGPAAIGKVYVEAMIIAVGNGRNGKSTFFNAIAQVLGSYSGSISAETLTQDCHHNVKPELAEIKGKRLIIASELKNGARLSEEIVKRLCSTDPIFAEKKYHDPFSFVPSHTLVLYTNHLPHITFTDDGIWRRLIVIPFGARIEGSSDIKNYADYLYENARPSILSWIIEGAQKVIEVHFQLDPPRCVKDAISAYRNDNDWLGRFLGDCCTIHPDNTESSAALYTAFRDYCMEQNLPAQSTAAFYSALEQAGFTRISKHRKRLIRGLSLDNQM